MPELPEIETVKSVIEPQIKGLTIEKVTVNRPEVIAQPSSAEVCQAVAGASDFLYGAQGEVFNHPFAKRKPHHFASAHDRMLAGHAA